jgi:hypothetical protein
MLLEEGGLCESVGMDTEFFAFWANHDGNNPTTEVTAWLAEVVEEEV